MTELETETVEKVVVSRASVDDARQALADAEAAERAERSRAAHVHALRVERAHLGGQPPSPARDRRAAEIDELLAAFDPDPKSRKRETA